MLGFAYGDDGLKGVKGSDYLMIGTLGYGVVATAFAGLRSCSCSGARTES